jgi:hypothetical protein
VIQRCPTSSRCTCNTKCVTCQQPFLRLAGLPLVAVWCSTSKTRVRCLSTRSSRNISSVDHCSSGLWRKVLGCSGSEVVGLNHNRCLASRPVFLCVWISRHFLADCLSTETALTRNTGRESKASIYTRGVQPFGVVGQIKKLV